MKELCCSWLYTVIIDKVEAEGPDRKNNDFQLSSKFSRQWALTQFDGVIFICGRSPVFKVAIQSSVLNKISLKLLFISVEFFRVLFRRKSGRHLIEPLLHCTFKR